MSANKDSTVSIYKNNERKWNSAYKCRTSEQLHQQSLTHHDGTGAPSQKHKALILTIPKDPGLETAQRSRHTRFKSADELEEEMLAKIPKFKARPLNKKYWRLHSCRHCKRLSHNYQSFRVKSSEELEQEELQKIPKFKARPLNKKIFCSKGDLGIFCNLKRQVTTLVGFHFATDECLPLPPPTELLKKERGAEKEMKFVTKLLEGEEKEQEAWIPKANPYPYTTDYPLIPAKPIPKECTKPEPFQLESLMRHEEELQRRMEELARVEREEQEMRTFRAQPIISNVPVHVPEMPRKPLTEVQEFTFHADARALERAEFDQKVKE